MSLLDNMKSDVTKIKDFLENPEVQTAIADIENGAEDVLTGQYGSALTQLLGAIHAIEAALTPAPEVSDSASAGTDSDAAATESASTTDSADVDTGTAEAAAS